MPENQKVSLLKMKDDGGGDEKIIAVPVPRLTKRYENVHDFTDFPEITREQIQHFFEHYKIFEPGKWVKMIGWGNAAEARQLIVDAIRRVSPDQILSVDLPPRPSTRFAPE